MKKILTVLSILLFCGCSNKMEKVKDNSLSIENYLEYGMPDIEKEWSADDYRRAVLSLDKVFKIDVTSAPRFKSQFSQKVFQKLIDTTSFNEFDKLEPSMKLMTLGQFVEPIGKMLMLYTKPIFTGKIFDDEIIELTNYMLIHSNLFVNLAYKNPSLISDESLIKKGVGQTINGCLTTFEDKHTFPPQLREKFSRYLSKQIPGLLRHTTMGTKVEIKIRIKNMIKKETNTTIISNLKKIII